MQSPQYSAGLSAAGSADLSEGPGRRLLGTALVVTAHDRENRVSPSARCPCRRDDVAVSWLDCPRSADRAEPRQAHSRRLPGRRYAAESLRPLPIRGPPMGVPRQLVVVVLKGDGATEGTDLLAPRGERSADPAALDGHRLQVHNRGGHAASIRTSATFTRRIKAGVGVANSWLRGHQAGAWCEKLRHSPSGTATVRGPEYVASCSCGSDTSYLPSLSVTRQLRETKIS